MTNRWAALLAAGLVLAMMPACTSSHQSTSAPGQRGAAHPAPPPRHQAAPPSPIGTFHLVTQALAGHGSQFPDPSAVQLQFLAAGRIRATGGCNYLETKVASTRGHLHLLALGTITQMGCFLGRSPAPSVTQDRVLFAFLGKNPTWTIRGSRLTLTEGTSTLAFDLRAQLPLSARVVLPSTTMAAGSSMRGRVVVENNSGHALHVGGCGGLFAVALSNAKIQPEVIWLACSRDFMVPVGESVYPVVVEATYLSCSPGRPQGAVMACLPNAQEPPLPQASTKRCSTKTSTSFRLHRPWPCG